MMNDDVEVLVLILLVSMALLAALYCGISASSPMPPFLAGYACGWWGLWLMGYE